jgi:hypothetical protein
LFDVSDENSAMTNQQAYWGKWFLNTSMPAGAVIQTKVFRSPADKDLGGPK